MTFESIDVLAPELRDDVISPARMRELVNLIVEKASLEAGFVTMYSNLCARFAKDGGCPSFADGRVTFRSMLLAELHRSWQEDYLYLHVTVPPLPPVPL